MLDPSQLRQWDRIVFGNNNRWTCETRIDCSCEGCDRQHFGWIMRSGYRCQLWWDTETHLWENSVLLSDWPEKEREIMRRNR